MSSRVTANGASIDSRSRRSSSSTSNRSRMNVWTGGLRSTPSRCGVSFCLEFIEVPESNVSQGWDLFLDDDRRTSVYAKNTDSLVWVVDQRNGGEFALLQVDPLSGVWVVRSRFPA